MAQINNGKLDGEAVEDFDTPEDDPDIKGSFKVIPFIIRISEISCALCL